VLGRFLPAVPVEKRDELMNIQDQIIAEGGVTGLERPCLTKDGYLTTVSLSAAPLHDAAGNVTGVVYLIMDVTRRKRAEEQLHQQAMSDELTGLPNRRFFNESMSAATAMARDRQSSLAVLYVDLDGFKVVNETMGHAAGDEILVQTAARLSAAVGRQGVVSRIGGDEFAVVVKDLSDAQPLEELGRRIRTGFRRSFDICGREIHATVSVGISVFPEFAGTRRSSCSRPISPCRKLSARGKTKSSCTPASWAPPCMSAWSLKVCFAAPSTGRDRCLLPAGIQREASKPCVFEALARWTHPKLGAVSPLRFIPVAESSGFIVPLGLWILEKACARAVTWQGTGPPVKVAVNVSAVQFFRDDFVPCVKEFWAVLVWPLLSFRLN